MSCMRMTEWVCETFCTCFCSTIWRGYRRALEYTDLWNMNPEDRASYVGARFEREWQKEVKRAKWVQCVMYRVISVDSISSFLHSFSCLLDCTSMVKRCGLMLMRGRVRPPLCGLSLKHLVLLSLLLPCSKWQMTYWRLWAHRYWSELCAGKHGKGEWWQMSVHGSE